MCSHSTLEVVYNLFSLILICSSYFFLLQGCNEYFSADTLWEVNAAWQDAVNYIAKDKTNLLALANDCALIIKENLFSK